MSPEDTEHRPASSRRHITTAERVSHAMSCLPRSLFWGSPHPAHAESGLDPIPPEPVLRRMFEALELTGTERVLEVGSSTAYQIALLSRLAREVVSVISDAASIAERGRILTQLGCRNVQLAEGREMHGWPTAAPYSAILIDAGITHVPALLLDQLELGGRLIAPLGDASGQLIELVHHRPEGFVSETRGFCHLPMLPSASQRPSFFPWHRT